MEALPLDSPKYGREQGEVGDQSMAGLVGLWLPEGSSRKRTASAMRLGRSMAPVHGRLGLATKYITHLVSTATFNAHTHIVNKGASKNVISPHQRHQAKALSEIRRAMLRYHAQYNAVRRYISLPTVNIEILR